MPYRSSRRSKSRKPIKRRRRPYGRRRNYKKRQYLPVGGMPKSKMVKLRYVSTFTHDPGTGLPSVYKFSANGCDDPDISLTGHQPSNWDRWKLFYDRYTVVGSKITMYPIEIDTANNTHHRVPGTMLLCLSEDGKTISNAAGGINNVLEQPRLKVTMKSLSHPNSYGYGKLTKTFSAKKFFGAPALGNHPFSCDVEAGPSETAFFECAYVSSDDYNNPSTMKFRAVIDYIIKFSEPKIADAS